MMPKLASIVAFYQARQIVLGLITEVADNRYKVCDASGACGWFNAGRFVLVSTGSFPLSDIPGCLNTFQHGVDAATDGVAAMDYSFMKDALTLEDIATRLQLNSNCSVFALYLHLKNHPEFFCHKKDTFRLKSADEQQAYLLENQLEQERSSYLSKVRMFLSGSEPEASVLDRLFNELPEIITYNKHRDLQRVIHEENADQSTEAAVRQLRIKCGELSKEIDPAIAASGISVGFSSQVLSEELLLANFASAACQAFSIDDEDTRDYDDAISLEQIGTGWKLGIHVCAVAACITIGGRLYAEALKRASSLYATNAVIPLIPQKYSEQELSLKAGQKSAVVSLYLTLDAACEVTGRELKLEEICISNNYSYRQVDKAISSEPFASLLRIGNKLREARQSTHSGDKQRFYYYLKEVNGVLQLRRIENDSPARMIIEELMIEYNSSFAIYAKEQGCPMIYRNITRFGSEDEENPASQAYLSTKAEFHPGIGASAYLHASSPIRRVTDLLNQYQMIALLTSAPLPFDAVGLETAIGSIERRLLLLRETSHRSQRYWLLRFLQEQYLQVPLDACLRAVTQGRLRIEIIPWGMQVLVKSDTYPRSDTFKLIITEVDWDNMSVIADIV